MMSELLGSQPVATPIRTLRPLNGGVNLADPFGPEAAGGAGGLFKPPVLPPALLTASADEESIC